MRTIAMTAVLLCCSCGLFPGDSDDDHLKGHALKARIMGDMQWRETTRGKGKDPSSCATSRDGKWFCKIDSAELEVVVLVEEEPDRPNRRHEEALYCPKEQIYWHRVVADGKDRVHGPFPLQY